MEEELGSGPIEPPENFYDAAEIIQHVIWFHVFSVEETGTSGGN